MAGAPHVVIVGGGPAGCAVALMLRRHAPGIEVTLVEASEYCGPRLGETLPPLASQLLKQLGLEHELGRFCAGGGARASHGVEILWGSPRPHYEHYLSRARGSGRHLDRRRFDAFLGQCCEQRGVQVRRQTRVRDVEPTGNETSGRWRLRLESRDSGSVGLDLEKPPTLESLTCDFVIDAAGRSAPVARRLGTRAITVDRLVASACFFDAVTGPPQLTVEAFEHGWWYAAGLPNDRLVAVCLTDADWARRLGLHNDEGWRAALPSAPVVASRVGDRSSEGPPLVRSAASRHLERAAADGWLAVGDAVSVFDPLSSQGITKALRCGIFAAYAVDDYLHRPERRPLVRFNRFVADEFNRFLKTRSEVYAQERRWPDRPFWRRRRVGTESSSFVMTSHEEEISHVS